MMMDIGEYAFQAGNKVAESRRKLQKVDKS
jgi:hypothetical protein